MSTTPPGFSLSAGPKYLVQTNTGDLYGPVPMATMAAWARGQRVSAEMLMAQENTEDWRRADSYPELHGIFHSPESQALEALEGSLPGGIPPSTGAAPSPGGYGVPAYAGPYVRPAGTNGLAVTSMVLGIVGLLVCPIIFSVLALIFGFIAQSQIRDSRGQQSGGGMATAGIVLGIVGIPLGCCAGMLLSGMR